MINATIVIMRTRIPVIKNALAKEQRARQQLIQTGKLAGRGACFASRLLLPPNVCAPALG